MDNYEKELLERIDSGLELSQGVLSTLVWDDYEVERTEGEKRRWHKTISSIVQLGDRYFKIKWEQSLTDSQPSKFFHQPVEVTKHTYKRTITVTKWKEVKKKG